MFVPCPHCQFLVAHHPQLRPLPADCPRCGRPLEDAAATPADDGGTAAAGPATPEAAAALDAGAAADAADTGDVPQPAPAIASTGIATASMPTSASTAAFAAPGRGRGSRWRWPLIVLLALLLALQILLADRARLAGDPRWRPLLESLCGVLHCDLPPWHEPAAFIMLDRKVRPAPQPGVLRVDATFRNDARWAQAWPALQLALSDADGRVLGSRVFAPADYLGAPPDALLSPGQSAQVTFLVREPAPGTVAFSFEFR